jgi:hypothetical protein
MLKDLFFSFSEGLSRDPGMLKVDPLKGSQGRLEPTPEILSSFFVVQNPDPFPLSLGDHGISVLKGSGFDRIPDFEGTESVSSRIRICFDRLTDIAWREVEASLNSTVVDLGVPVFVYQEILHLDTSNLPKIGL